MPDEPADDRLGRFTQEKDPLPRNEYVVEPHLAVELVVTAAQRRDERVLIAHRNLAADRRDALRIDRHDESRAMPLDLKAAKAADINVLGKGRARVHADLAADNDPAVGLAHQLQRSALGRIFAHAGADRRGAAAEGQETPGAGDHLAVAGGVGDLLGGNAPLLDRGL